MSIKTRLVFGLSMLLALIVAQAFIAMDQVGRLRNITQEVAVVSMERVEYVAHVATELSQLRAAELGLLLSANPDEERKYQNEIRSLWDSVGSSIELYHNRIEDTGRLADYEAFLTHIEKYQAFGQQFMTLNESGRDQDAQLLFTRFQGEFDQMMNHIHRLRHEEFAASLEMSAVAQGLTSRSRHLFIVAVLVVGIVELGLGWYIWKSLSGGLEGLLEGTRRVSKGDLSQSVPEGSRDEFGELASSFNAMVSSLKASQEENQRLAQVTMRMQEERIQLLRGTLEKVVGAQELERTRVARELHDQAGQALTALQFGLAQLERSADSPQLKEQAASLRSLTVETMNEIRNLALDLRPSILDELGLVPALRSYVRDFSRRISVPIEFETSGLNNRLPPEAELILFRVVQEGLTNVAKHSKATAVKVSLTADKGQIEARVEDNGAGFYVEEVLKDSGRKSLGIFGMRERIGLLNGTVDVQSSPGQGTRLIFTVPQGQKVERGGDHEQDKGPVG